jgi:transcription initiation factor TFIID TATA-box-binding protein
LAHNSQKITIGIENMKELITKTIDKTIKMLTPYARSITKTKKPQIDITNIVAAASLGIDLDLYKIAYKIKDVEYEPEQFPGAILKFKEPKASLLLFKNGKVICAGAKNEKEISDVLAKAKKMLLPYAEKQSK